MHREPVREGSADDPLAAAFAALVDGPVVRRWMHRDGRRLGWVQSGEGGPTVVLEAGAMSPVASFAAVFQQLAADFHVVAYDRAGYGVSDAAPLTLELQLGDLVAVLDAAGDGPCVVVGHSWGGLLAQVAAWSRPDLIAGLVLVDPAHESLYDDLPAETAAELGRHPSRTKPPRDDPRAADLPAETLEEAEDVARSVGADPHVLTLLTTAFQSYVATDDQVFTQLDELPMILDHIDEIAVRRASSSSAWTGKPLVVLTATKGRPPDSTKQVLALQEALVASVGGRHIVVPDSGHYIHIDRPDLVVRAVRDVTQTLSRMPRNVAE